MCFSPMEKRYKDNMGNREDYDNFLHWGCTKCPYATSKYSMYCGEPSSKIKAMVKKEKGD